MQGLEPRWPVYGGEVDSDRGTRDGGSWINGCNVGSVCVEGGGQGGTGFRFQISEKSGSVSRDSVGLD